jgi:hypothetical protein
MHGENNVKLKINYFRSKLVVFHFWFTAFKNSIHEGLKGRHIPEILTALPVIIFDYSRRLLQHKN